MAKKKTNLSEVQKNIVDQKGLRVTTAASEATGMVDLSLTGALPLGNHGNVIELDATLTLHPDALLNFLTSLIDGPWDDAIVASGKPTLYRGLADLVNRKK